MSAPQLSMVVDDPREIERDADEQGLLFERLLAACKAVARERTYDVVAAALDAIWGSDKRGRPVSSSVLRAALNDARGNYFRLEWALWFARESEEVADLLLEIAGRGRPTKKPEDELADLQQVVRREYPNQAEKMIAKSKLPRGGRR